MIISSHFTEVISNVIRNRIKSSILIVLKMKTKNKLLYRSLQKDVGSASLKINIQVRRGRKASMNLIV